MSDTLRLNDKNCPLGTFTFAVVTGAGIKNEKASTRKKDVYEYKVVLELDIDEAGPLLDTIDDFLEDNIIKGAELVGLPYQTKDDYDGIPDGKVWLRAKANVEFEDKKTGDIKDTLINIYDATGEKVYLPEGKGIGNGTTGLIIGNIVMWDRGDEYGATLWLGGVQIADYVPYEFGDAPAALTTGSFKGFDTPQLQKDEEETTEAPKQRERTRTRTRDRSSSDDEAPKQRERTRTRDRSKR